MFNTSEAEAYLMRRFGKREGYVAMAFKIKEEHIELDVHRFRWPTEAPMLGREVNYRLKLNPQTDVYICPTLRSSPGRRSEFNELEGYAVFADLDGGVIPADLLPWTELIASGTPGHYHAYINLTEPVSLERIEKLNYALKTVAKGDHKWRESTVLRLPGTLNNKHGNPVVTEKLADNTIKAETLEAYLKNYMPNNAVMKSRKAPDFNMLTPVPELPKYLEKLWLEDAVVGNRSTQSFHFIATCFEKGLTYDQVGALVHSHAPTVAKFETRMEWVVFNIMNKRHSFMESFAENFSTWLPKKS